MSKMTIKNLPDAALVAIRALFDYEYLEQNHKMYYQELGYRDYEPNAADEQGNALSGPQKGVLTVEEQEYGDNTNFRGYPVAVNLRKYTSKLTLSEEQVHWLSVNDKKISEVKDLVRGHINALIGNVNLDACKMYYLGFGTTFAKIGDGLSLFNKAHTIRANANTYANTFPTGDTHRAFGDQALIDSINFMDRFVAMSGEEMRLCSKIRIICAKELAPTVWKTIKSLYGPNNANMGMSAASEEALKSRGVSIDYFVAEDIPYAYRNYWFLVDLERAKDMLLMDWGWKPRLNDQWEYRNGSSFNLGSVFFGPRALSWQFAFGSKGDTSAI